MKGKRVEYQKYLRTKFEQGRYRELFGLTDNIELRGEEDIVLQREFRIDFSLQKKEAHIGNSVKFSVSNVAPPLWRSVVPQWRQLAARRHAATSINNDFTYLPT